jgi:glycosyltransferase involved in cell wall biosynthesis
VESPNTAPRYSVIIPAHNEAARLARTLRDYLSVFADSEVLVVLNGCTDRTAEVAREAGRGVPGLRILDIDHAVGKGGAVRAGFVTARAPLVGYVDADGATPAAELRRLFVELEESNDDAVIASRWSRGSEVIVAQPTLRRLSSRIFNAVVRLLFGLPFRDTQCGAKVFRRSAVRAVSTSLEVSNFAFDVDLLYNLSKAGHTIREVPTRWYDVAGSRIHLADASRQMLLAIARLRLRHSFFRYALPIFDRLWPIKRLRVHDGLAILVLDARDPEHPRAGDADRYLFEVGKRLVQRGHRVDWICAKRTGADTPQTCAGIHTTPLRNFHLALPVHYLRRCRDRFDVVISVQHAMPTFSWLFSLKPKLTMIDSTLVSRLDPLARMGRWLLRSDFGGVTFIAGSAKAYAATARLGVPRERIRTAFVAAGGAYEWDLATQSFLSEIYRHFSHEHIISIGSEDERLLPPLERSVAEVTGTGPEQQPDASKKSRARAERHGAEITLPLRELFGTFEGP